MNRKDRRSTQRAIGASKLALALAAAGLAAVAQAETSPWYVGARETVTRDSNVFRTPDATSDTIFTTGLFGGLDQYLGRQHLRADLQANWNRYRNVDALNHTDGSAGLKLDWETIEHLSGDLQLNHQRQLYRDFAQASDAGQKVIVNSTDAAFNARLGVVTAWTLEAGVFGSRSRFSAPLAGNNINYDGWRGGVRFAPSSLLQLGLGYRRTNGKYPDAAVANDFRRNDVDLTLGWNPNGISSFSGRISRTKLEYPNLATSSNSLTTGELAYRWNPGGRTAIDVSLTRDNNAGQALSDVVIAGLSGQQHSTDTRVSTTAALAGHYELTGKIQLGLDLRHIDRKLDNTLSTELQGIPLGTTPASASDSTNSIGLNATYDPTRTLRFTCGFTHMKRSVDGPDAATLTYPYSVNLTSCTAQFAIQP